MPLKLAKELQGLLEAKVHTFTTLWRIERTDGEIFRFTDHDRVLPFTYDTTEEDYQPAGGFDASARERQAGIREHNTETVGIISADAITDDDLRAGKFREAKVIELLIDWKFPYAGYYEKKIYYITTLTYDTEIWKAQLSAIPAWMRKEVGIIINKNTCRHVFGQGICGQGVDVEDLRVSGTVSSVTNPRRDFTASGLGQPADYFNYGEVTWVTGANAGRRDEIVGHLTGGRIQLPLFTPYNIQVGDTFTIIPGCDHRIITCVYYDNFINYGGFPFIPGTDALIGGPVP